MLGPPSQHRARRAAMTGSGPALRRHPACPRGFLSLRRRTLPANSGVRAATTAHAWPWRWRRLGPRSSAPLLLHRQIAARQTAARVVASWRREPAPAPVTIQRRGPGSRRRRCRCRAGLARPRPPSLQPLVGDVDKGRYPAAVAYQRELALADHLELVTAGRHRGARTVERAVALRDALRPLRAKHRLF